MVRRKKRCCACKKTVCYVVADEYRTVKVETVVPFKLFQGKYWCNDCFNERREK